MNFSFSFSFSILLLLLILECSAIGDKRLKPDRVGSGSALYQAGTDFASLSLEDVIDDSNSPDARPPEERLNTPKTLNTPEIAANRNPITPISHLAYESSRPNQHRNPRRAIDFSDFKDFPDVPEESDIAARGPIDTQSFYSLSELNNFGESSKQLPQQADSHQQISGTNQIHSFLGSNLPAASLPPSFLQYDDQQNLLHQQFLGNSQLNPSKEPIASTGSNQESAGIDHSDPSKGLMASPGPNQQVGGSYLLDSPFGSIASPGSNQEFVGIDQLSPSIGLIPSPESNQESAGIHQSDPSFQQYDAQRSLPHQQFVAGNQMDSPFVSIAPQTPHQQQFQQGYNPQSAFYPRNIGNIQFHSSADSNQQQYTQQNIPLHDYQQNIGYHHAKQPYIFPSISKDFNTNYRISHQQYSDGSSNNDYTLQSQQPQFPAPPSSSMGYTFLPGQPNQWLQSQPIRNNQNDQSYHNPDYPGSSSASSTMSDSRTFLKHNVQTVVPDQQWLIPHTNDPRVKGSVVQHSQGKSIFNSHPASEGSYFIQGRKGSTSSQSSAEHISLPEAGARMHDLERSSQPRKRRMASTDARLPVKVPSIDFSEAKVNLITNIQVPPNYDQNQLLFKKMLEFVNEEYRLERKKYMVDDQEYEGPGFVLHATRDYTVPVNEKRLPIEIGILVRIPIETCGVIYPYDVDDIKNGIFIRGQNIEYSAGFFSKISITVQNLEQRDSYIHEGMPIAQMILDTGNCPK